MLRRMVLAVRAPVRREFSRKHVQGVKQNDMTGV